MNTIRSLYRGKFLEFLVADTWEYVQRPGHAQPVGIVALTAEGRIILISQRRIPVDKICVEIPAGLTDAGESWQTAALRELREETGYAATDIEYLTHGPSSAGLTNECMTFGLARGVTKVGAPQPDGDEQITVHEVPLEEVGGFLLKMESQGCLIDPKVYVALYFVKQ